MKEIILVGCNLFSATQLVQICINLESLEIVDSTRCVCLMFCYAYTIVYFLQSLRQINFEQKNRHVEMNDWKRLVSTFLNIQFGHAAMAILPHYGKYLRVPSC